MGDTVVAVVNAYLPCDRVKAGFREFNKELQLLPVHELGYLRKVDFASPLEITSSRNAWVRVCIEHFTNWVE